MPEIAHSNENRELSEAEKKAQEEKRLDKQQEKGREVGKEAPPADLREAQNETADALSKAAGEIPAPHINAVKSKPESSEKKGETTIESTENTLENNKEKQKPNFESKKAMSLTTPNNPDKLEAGMQSKGASVDKIKKVKEGLKKLIGADKNGNIMQKFADGFVDGAFDLVEKIANAIENPMKALKQVAANFKKNFSSVKNAAKMLIGHFGGSVYSAVKAIKDGAYEVGKFVSTEIVGRITGKLGDFLKKRRPSRSRPSGDRPSRNAPTGNRPTTRDNRESESFSTAQSMSQKVSDTSQGIIESAASGSGEEPKEEDNSQRNE